MSRCRFTVHCVVYSKLLPVYANSRYASHTLHHYIAIFMDICYCVYIAHLVLQLLRLYFAEASGLIKGDIFGLRYIWIVYQWCPVYCGVALQYTVVYCGVALQYTVVLLSSILWYTVVTHAMPCSDPYVRVTFAHASGLESLRGEKTSTIKKVCYTAEQDLWHNMVACSLTQSSASLDGDISSYPGPAQLSITCSIVMHASNRKLGRARE